MLYEFCPNCKRNCITLCTESGRRGIRPWSCHDCYYYAPKTLIAWYLLSSSAASRLPGKKERAVSRLGLQPKQWLSQGLGRESEGLAFTAWKGPALTRLVHTRCCVVWDALLLSSTCRPLGSHVLGVLQTTSHCWELKKKKKKKGTWEQVAWRRKFSASIQFSTAEAATRRLTAGLPPAPLNPFYTNFNPLCKRKSWGVPRKKLPQPCTSLQDGIYFRYWRSC